MKLFFFNNNMEEVIVAVIAILILLVFYYIYSKNSKPTTNSVINQSPSNPSLVTNQNLSSNQNSIPTEKITQYIASAQSSAHDLYQSLCDIDSLTSDWASTGNLVQATEAIGGVVPAAAFHLPSTIANAANLGSLVKTVKQHLKKDNCSVDCGYYTQIMSVTANTDQGMLYNVASESKNIPSYVSGVDHLLSALMSDLNNLANSGYNAVDWSQHNGDDGFGNLFRANYQKAQTLSGTFSTLVKKAYQDGYNLCDLLVPGA